MKTFWMVSMLLALLVTAWLMMRDVSQNVTGGAPAAVKTLERAEQAVKKMDTSNQAAERRLDGAAKE